MLQEENFFSAVIKWLLKRHDNYMGSARHALRVAYRGVAIAVSACVNSLVPIKVCFGVSVQFFRFKRTK